MILRVLIVLFLVVITTSNCAKRSRPTGGPKDSIAPVLVKAIPPFKTVNFKGDEIRINFDEFIKLKDLNKQLVISPPMKYQPIISPQGTPSKFIKIKILDTLKENTTYTFNFGQSVTDNTEGNVLENFKYVFSTGAYIDSLKVSGTIKDAFSDEADKNVSILLYEFNEAYTDSLIYKEKPLYVANTLDTTIWEITNIKEGKYKLVALKDASRDYKFTPKQDKIAFLEEEITIPRDSVDHELVLFKEILPYRINRPSEETKNRLWFGYEGQIDSSFQIKNLLEKTNSLITKEENKDTLNYWYKGAVLDSLFLEIRNSNFVDTLVVRKRTKNVDSLVLKTNAVGALSLKQKLKLLSNIPVAVIDTSKIILLDKDTVKVKYQLKFKRHQQEAVFDFLVKAEQKYKIEAFPGAITDYLGNTNDTLQLLVRTKKPTDYGTINFALQNVERFPVIVQLVKSTNGKNEFIEEEYLTENKKVSFKTLEPAKYKIRIIYDSNENGKWDTGNFLLKNQPEEVTYFPKELDVRANWEIDETFILK